MVVNELFHITTGRRPTSSFNTFHETSSKSSPLEISEFLESA